MWRRGKGGGLSECDSKQMKEYRWQSIDGNESQKAAYNRNNCIKFICLLRLPEKLKFDSDFVFITAHRQQQQ